MTKEEIATLTVYLDHMHHQKKYGNLDGVSNTIQKAKKYIQHKCTHETINAGDQEHVIAFCQLCDWIQPPYDDLSHTDNVPY